MRILMLAHRIPYPPHTGDKNRAFCIARHLATRHDLTLAFVVDDPADWDGLDPLRQEIPTLEFAGVWKPWGLAKGLVGLATGAPLTLPYFASRKLRRRIAPQLRGDRYDLVYVSSSSMAQYVEGIATTPVVMDFVDVDSDKWTQYSQRSRPPLAWLYRTEGRRLQRYEARIARSARLCIVTTRVEEELLKSFAPWARTAVVPNGVNLTHLEPVAQPPTDATIIFTGAMDYFPNIDAVNFFCADVYPHVRREVPGTRFLIVGLNPPPSVLRLASLPGVLVTGSVPDVKPYYARSSVCVAPLRIARGVQNKILQAMAMGLPVVATSRATQGLEARPEHDLLVEDQPGAFAARVVGLLRDREARLALGRRARAFVEAHHSWDSSLARLDGLLAEATGRSGLPPAPGAESAAGQAAERGDGAGPRPLSGAVPVTGRASNP